jgi:hypothetical protein
VSGITVRELRHVTELAALLARVGTLRKSGHA